MTYVIASWALVTGAPSPATTGTSLSVTTGHGARFPNGVQSNEALIYSVADPGINERVRITNRSTDTFTIVRNIDSRGAQAITSSGWALHLQPAETAVIPLVPVTGVTWAFDTHGSLGPVAAHFEKADGADAPVTFAPVITPADFGSNLKLVCIFSSSVGGGNVINDMVIQETLPTGDAATALLINGNVAMAANASANTTARGETTPVTPTVGSLLHPYMGFGRTSGADTNTGTASIWACFLEYTRR